MALQMTETEAERAVYIAHDRVGLTHQVLAEAIAEPGLSIADAKAFIRNMGAAGYVKPYGRGRADKRTPHLYRPDAALALAAYADGFCNFAADIAFFHQPGQRKPLVSARYRQMQDGTERGTNFAPEAVGLELRSSWTCPLDPVLAHLMRRREAIH